MINECAILNRVRFNGKSKATQSNGKPEAGLRKAFFAGFGVARNAPPKKEQEAAP